MTFKTIQGVKLPVLGLGTWHMGMGGADHKEVDAIRAAIELGMTHIDTAEAYSQGHSEELVGQAIKDYPRQKLFITTKVSAAHFHYDDLIASCKASLDRLGTPFIDLYLLHWPGEVDLKETMEAMDYLIDQGLILHAGVSNFSVPLMKEAATNSKNQIFTNQVEYSLYDLSPEHEILPYCQDHDICLTAYSPLGGIGKVSELQSDSTVGEIAKHYNKTPIQVALNYLICQDKTIAIPKSSDIEHIKEIVGAVGWELSKEDLQKLKEAFRT